MKEEITEIHLRNYLHILKKRRWTVISTLVILVTLVTIYTMTSKPIYRATVQLLIERDNPKVVSIEEVLAIDATSTDYYQTQYELLKSDNLARRVVNRFDQIEKDWAKVGAVGSENGLLRENQRIEAFQGALLVKPKRNSRLVDLSFESIDPEYAAMAVNMLADEYINFNVENKIKASREARAWLEKQVEEMRTKVQVSETAFEDFKQSIPNRIRLRVQSGKTTSEMENRPEVVHNAFIQELRTEDIKLSAKMADLSQKYGPKHPKIIRLSSEIKMIRDQMDAEIRRVVSALMIEESPEYMLLKRDAEANRKLYEVLLTRLKETAVTENLPQSNIHIVDPAQVPRDYVKPRRIMNILVSGVLGLLLGVGLAFFFEYLDNTIHDPKDIEQFMGIPFLGTVPSFGRGRGPSSIDLIVSKLPKSPQAEAYRTIRTGILFAMAERQPKTVLITSPGPLEGKTTTAANLALAMAQAGGSVLLIDADLRKPRLHQLFDQDNFKGLSSVLVGETNLETSIVQTSSVFLSLLSSGPLPPNPAELLGSQAMKEFIKDLEGKFDRIVIDSPPCIPVTDPIVLSALCDGVVLVLKDSRTTKEMAANARKRLGDAKARILGGILNDVNPLQGGHYYPYYHDQSDEEEDRERSIAT